MGVSTKKGCSGRRASVRFSFILHFYLKMLKVKMSPGGVGGGLGLKNRFKSLRTVILGFFYVIVFIF